MTVNEILTVLDLAQIHTFKINDTTKSLLIIRSRYGNCVCKKLEIKTSNKAIVTNDIKYNIISDLYDPDSTIIQGVEIILPENSTYISVDINFVLDYKEAI